MLLATSMAPPLCGEAAAFLAFVLPAMPNHLYIKSRSLSARYPLIRSHILWLHQCSASFLLLPADTHGAGQGRCELQSHQTPESHQAAGTRCWHWALSCCGEQQHPTQSQCWALSSALGLLLAGLRCQTDPCHRRGWEGNYRRPLWSWAISKGKPCLSLNESLAESECWGCPHHCTVRDAPCFSCCHTGRIIVWDPSTTNPLLDLQAPHEWNSRKDKNNTTGRAAR